MIVDYPLFRLGCERIRAELGISGCLVMDFGTKNNINSFPLYDTIKGIEGILPVYRNDNYIHNDY